MKTTCLILTLVGTGALALVLDAAGQTSGGHGQDAQATTGGPRFRDPLRVPPLGGASRVSPRKFGQDAQATTRGSRAALRPAERLPEVAAAPPAPTGQGQTRPGAGAALPLVGVSKAQVAPTVGWGSGKVQSPRSQTVRAATPVASGLPASPARGQGLGLAIVGGPTRGSAKNGGILSGTGMKPKP